MKAFFLLLVMAISVAAQTTRTVCAAGCDHTTINAAIDASACGDTIEIEAGETFTEDVVLDHKGCSSSYVTIQSSALGSLPAAGNRVAPADASNMPTIRSTAAASASAISTVSGANPTGYYKLIGLQILRHDSTSNQTAVIKLGTTGSSQDSIDEMPHNIIIDRCLIRGADNASTRRGIQLDAKDSQVINSYIDNFWETGADSQAIAAWNGGQNILIANNFLEGASENLLTGGSDPSITNFVPNNWTIEHNHFFKRLSWVGAGKVVKNLLEFKNADTVTIRNNIFENCWADGQDGRGIHFSLRNQDGTAPWTTVKNMTFEYNIVKNVGNGISFLVEDDSQTSVPQDNITIRNNLVLISGDDNSGQGWAMLFAAGQTDANDYTIDHNTFIHAAGTNRFIESQGQDFITNLVITNNIVAGDSGDIGRISANGNAGEVALNYIVDGDSWTITGNVIQRSSTGMPTGNDYVSAVTDFDFVDYTNGDYELDVTSDFKGAAPGGLDPGVNWDELIARTDEVEAGTNYTEGSPTGVKARIGGSVRFRGIRLN